MKHRKHTGKPNCPLCGGRGGAMVVTTKGRRWIRCQCMRPNREALKLQRKFNAPPGWVQKSLMEQYKEQKAEDETRKRDNAEDQ